MTETYDVEFDKSSKKFLVSPGTTHNARSLLMMQRYANDKLRAMGHLFLNEVLDMLDLPREARGQTDGWVYQADRPDLANDNFVGFGIEYEDDRITLHFNVQKNIIDTVWGM